MIKKKKHYVINIRFTHKRDRAIGTFLHAGKICYKEHICFYMVMVSPAVSVWLVDAGMSLSECLSLPAAPCPAQPFLPYFLHSQSQVFIIASARFMSVSFLRENFEFIANKHLFIGILKLTWT